MLEETTNILSPQTISRADAICFTSNGIRKRNGEAVMGAGVAKAFANTWPHLPKLLGDSLRTYGNLCKQIAEVSRGFEVPLHIYAFPTKDHWMNDSYPALISKSAWELRTWADIHEYKRKIFLTRPGCGNGRLRWEDVKPLLEPFLDHRFVICHL